ncbi:MAG TPA: hypothetical protein VID73_12660 [Ktedonobacterales bacterium]
MSQPPTGHDAIPRRAARGEPRRHLRRALAGKRRALTLASAGSFILALGALALPAMAYADTNSLTAYGATASGWAIQPYVVNDAFLNVPAADQSAPYAFITMDNTPGARARASYLFPGTAVNAVPNTQGVAVSVPDGVEARYPGNGSASTKVGEFNDGVAAQSAAGTQAAQASEGYAQAQAALANYQFAPPAFAPPAPPTLPPVAVPTLPGSVPTPPAAPGLTPTPTMPAAPATPAPTATHAPICIGPLCVGPTPDSSQTAPRTTTLAAPAPAATPAPIALPDTVEQTLAAALKAAQISNPDLLSLAGGKLAAPDPKLPYAAADAASQATARATDSGVTVQVYTRATNVQLLQGLISFASVESTLDATAPAAAKDGSGTIATRIAGATIGGVPVTIDDKGVTVQDQNASADQVHALTDQLNAALAQANIHIEVIKTVTSAKTGFWEGAGAAVEVTAGVSPSATGLPSPASGVPGTKVDFTLAQVSANVYATPGQPTADNGGSSDTGGGFGFGFGQCCDASGGNTSGNGGTTTTHGKGTSLSVLGGLSGGALLALVFVVQGLSTAAAAATAGYTDLAAKASEGISEEETP